MTGPIVVINPNSTQAVTDGIAAALGAVEGEAIECLTLTEGPPGIESDDHVAAVIGPLCDLVRTRPDAGAFVNACFSDPGLAAVRAATPRPVFGIGESAYLAACDQGRRFGVLSILPAAVARHARYIEELGLTPYCAGDRALGLGVVELADEKRTAARLLEVGRALRDHDGAETLILGCAGMAGHRGALEEALELPVVEPCQAAVARARGQLAGAE
ncbi:MAG: aspartate/glutamate racemase family protein [Pseudomonadota bacterium]